MAEERFRTAIATEFEAGEIKARGRIQNLGEGGLFVGTPSVPEAGEKIELNLDPPSGRRVAVSGVVWWTRNGLDPYGRQTSGFGVRLVNAGKAYRTLLQRLRREVKAARERA